MSPVVALYHPTAPSPDAGDVSLMLNLCHPITPSPDAGGARAEHPLKLRAQHALQNLFKTLPAPRMQPGVTGGLC